MPEDKQLDFNKVQKGNRPKIEEVIFGCLDGDARMSALDFTAFMQGHKMPIKLFTSTPKSQRAICNGKPICNILVFAQGDRDRRGNPNGPQGWSISLTLEHMDEYKDTIIAEGLAGIVWDEVFYCIYKGNRDRTDINTGCARCAWKGADRTIFGGEYTSLCWWRWPEVFNPDEATVKRIKRLLKLEQTARENS